MPDMKNIIMLILLLFASTAQAEEVDPKYFQSWLTLCDLLQSKGIIPSAPSWSVIIPMCLPLKKSDDETAYNRCLYEKTMDEFQWPTDYKYCETQAEAQYIRAYTQNADLQNKQAPRTVIVTNANGTRQIIDYVPPTTTYSAPPKSKDGYFQDCMMNEKNWNSYQRWTVGKHKPPENPITTEPAK